MPIVLNQAVLRDKNALHGGNPFLLLLAISVPGVADVLRVVLNTEDIIWRGAEWKAMEFELDEIGQGAGEVPQVELRVANPSRVFDPYIDQYDAWVKKYGFSPISVHIIVINTADMVSGAAVVDHEYELVTPKSTEQWVTFTLGASNPFEARFPLDRILKTHCRYKFRDRRCGYSGTVTTCGHTLSDCRKRGNSARFGGFPGIGRAGIYITET